MDDADAGAGARGPAEVSASYVCPSVGCQGGTNMAQRGGADAMPCVYISWLVINRICAFALDAARWSQ